MSSFLAGNKLGLLVMGYMGNYGKPSSRLWTSSHLVGNELMPTWEWACTLLGASFNNSDLKDVEPQVDAVTEMLMKKTADDLLPRSHMIDYRTRSQLASLGLISSLPLPQTSPRKESERITKNVKNLFTYIIDRRVGLHTVCSRDFEKFNLVMVVSFDT